MIFTKDILFIHVPKTGGSSVAMYLLQELPKPVYYSHPNFGCTTTTDTGVVQIPGVSHENLAEAKILAAQFGFDIHAMPLVMATLRNPYSLEVSRYAYLQKKLSYDHGYNQDLALYEDFETFACESYDHGGNERSLQSYYLLDGKIPSNLHILRTESLERDLRSALHEAGVEAAGQLPTVNTSQHGDFSTYYTKTAEAAVYRRYQWVFERGFYSRLDPSVLPDSKPQQTDRHALPLGYACQLGAIEGLLRDGTVRERLKVQIGTLRKVGQLVIEGVIPDHPSRTVELVLAINGQKTTASFKQSEPFRWTVPCALPVGSTAEVEMTAADGTFDSAIIDREQTFHLTRMTFQEGKDGN